jgi:hypothetical protein
MVDNKKGGKPKGNAPAPKPAPKTPANQPALVATGDGFYRWADITFEWAKACDNEYEVSTTFTDHV